LVEVRFFTRRLALVLLQSQRHLASTSVRSKKKVERLRQTQRHAHGADSEHAQAASVIYAVDGLLVSIFISLWIMSRLVMVIVEP
jgi:hypothetical protein